MNLVRRGLISAIIVAMGACALYAANKPKSVIHVVTVKWKPGTTPEQIQKALDGVEALGKEFPGIKNVWLRAFKVQDPTDKGFTHVIVMEFDSEESLKKYHNSAAQKKWYEVYLPIREESFTHDITN
jgi:hypothetical protein